MALEEYVGAIVLTVDGQDVEVIDFNYQGKTGRKLVKTMNRTGRAKGFSQGIAEYDLSLTVVIPETGDLDWEAIQGSKLTTEPLTPGGPRVSYLDCFTTEASEKYTVDNEARRDLKMVALRRVTE
ncbi:TPA: phage tail protein [Burkholderia vietnamiensis]|nr:phage tail protein [Burkholderia vietnamiensis]